MEQLLENIQMDRDFPFLFYRFHYDENTAFSYYHYHNYIEITLVWNGAIEYTFEDGTKVRAGAGDIVLVNNIEPHSVRGTKERASIAVLGFLPDLVWNGASDTDFSYIESFFNSGEVFENHIPASRAYSDEIVSLIRQIGVERDRKEDGYKMMIKTKLMQILTILYRYHPKKKQSVNRRFLAKTQPVSQYIRENCTRPLSLCECAGFCSYSPAYFSKLFHEVWGMRFSDYLCRVRVETSAKLLRESTLSVKEVFERSGFQSFSAFSEAFKKHTGATPLQYRKRLTKGSYAGII